MTEFSDADLIMAVRAGDRDAYGVLWGRHETAARSLARQIAKPSDVDELVSESFYRVLRALARGGGPDGAFRPYLLSTLRRINIDMGRGYYQRVSLTDNDTELEGAPIHSAADIAIEQGEQTAAWKAWASLPDSSRALLWHLIVEEETPAQIAPLMGTTPNGVSSRGVRAKERLRQAFLQQHVREAESEQCQWTRVRVGGYVRDALSSREHNTVAHHLKRCRRCTAVVAEIADVNATLKGVVAPVVLGAAAAGYLHATGATHLVGAGQLRRLFRPSVAAGTAAAAAVAGITYALVAHGGGHHAATPPQLGPFPQAAQIAQPPPTQHPKPKPARSAPSPTPAPTPTPTVTPAPTRHRLAPPAPPRAPTPTAPASTPTPTAPAARPPAPDPTPGKIQLTIHARVGVGVSIVYITAPDGWTIDAVATPGRSATCSITGPRTAQCRLAKSRRTGHHISVTATAPRRADSPARLRDPYRDFLSIRETR